MPSAKDLIAEGSEKLKDHRCPDAEPGRDAVFLAAHALNRSREWLLAHSETAVAPAAVRRYRALLARRLKHEPLSYLLGTANFRGRTFEVRRGTTLIPRWATETLTLAAAKELSRLPQLVALDVGTGSGCIAVSLAADLSQAQIIATDASASALAIAKRNAAALGFRGCVVFRRGDLAAPALRDLPDGRPLAVVANLPYLPDSSFASLPPEIRLYEPKNALVAGPDGLDLYRRLADQLAAVRHRPLFLFWEALTEQYEPLKKIVMEKFPSASCRPIANDTGITIGLAASSGS